MEDELQDFIRKKNQTSIHKSMLAPDQIIIDRSLHPDLWIENLLIPQKMSDDQKLELVKEFQSQMFLDYEAGVGKKLGLPKKLSKS